MDEDSVCKKEDEWLTSYLSNCKFDKENHHLHLPEDDQEDQGFKCTFYREAKERMFEVSADGECFTVIVLDQKGWDSDNKNKRPQKQVGTSIFLTVDKQFSGNSTYNKMKYYRKMHFKCLPENRWRRDWPYLLEYEFLLNFEASKKVKSQTPS